MINTLLGIKKNMTSGYDARGRRVGITVVEISPNFVIQVKNKDEKDGYDSVQLGFGNKKSVKKPQLGHLKKAGIEQKMRWMREVPTSPRLRGVNGDEVVDNIKPGQEIKIDQVFSVGDSVKVTGTSKGKGFQGGVRRHGFHGGPKTHGQSDRHRAPGSIGAGTTPGRVYRGKRMAGHMGSEAVSVRGLEIVGVDKGNNLLMIKGAVPGFNGALVTVTKLGRIKGYTPPPEEKPEEEEETVQKDSENSESQKVSEPEDQKSDFSDTSDSSGAPSNSESSESEVKEDAES